MQLVPYLNFPGNCAEAFRFYEKLFGGKIETMMRFDESPMADEAPPEQRNNIIHAYLSIGDAVLMGSDAPPEYFAKPQGISVSVQLTDIEQGERIFKELAKGGNVGMPFEKTFWAERFGMVTDRYGIPWMINCGPA